VFVLGEPGERLEAVRDAATRAGAELVGVEDADAVICAGNPNEEELRELLDTNPAVSWVQLPGAGVESVSSVIDGSRQWTCAKGSFAAPVAEHALGLALMGLRGGVRYARRKTWSEQFGTNLLGGRVTILGAGGIASELMRLLEPFETTITVVRHSSEPMPGAARTVRLDELRDAVSEADVVFVALALTPETEHVIDEAALGAMKPWSWLVNVGRGKHIDTSALLDALESGQIGGAALDVTDPEPLPNGHPLWDLPNVVITPHTGNTAAMNLPLYLMRVKENVGRFRAGGDLVGVVDPELGY
jgi:phosphoglycerate dehydrogenase-like enzyme